MQLHRSNRAEALVDALARVVAVPPTDPFEAEWIVVQGPGMERWLSLELSARLGIFAHARFPFPRAFLQHALETVLGESPDVGEEWEPEGLAWAIADCLPARLADPRFARIRAYLDDDDGGDEKSLALARRIAETFDHYAVYRPEMVLAWERGDDAAARRWSGRDGEWQPALWRDLVARQGSDHWASRVGRLVDAMAAGRGEGAALPARASLFGLSTLPPLFVSAFAALAARIELHAFVLSPSREYWGWIRSEREQLRAQRHAPDGLDPAGDLHLDEGHPLLASLGRVGRDFQEILEERVDYHEPDEDLYVDPEGGAEAGGPSLLHGLQSDILALRARGGAEDAAPPRPLEPGDRSIGLHACHGPMREAQVLRDQLLDRFARDPSLAPHDVVVMAPDARLYAPYVEAAFGADAEQGLAIPVRVADRGPRTAFPVVDAWSRVVATLGGRVTAGEVLDLLGAECIRARFGIDAEEETLLRAWIGDAGIRWGIDASHRVHEGQPASAANTWAFGLDRLFAGMAIDDGPGRLFAGVAPLRGVEGAEAESLGRLADLTSTLFDLHDRARGPRAVDAWAKLLREVLDRMIEPGPDGVHERQRVVEAVEALERAVDRAGHRTPVTLGAVIDAVGAALERSTTAGGFLTGAVTVCEMLPMRSIPFRVVALMGMNDKAFPRVRPRPGFDLIGARRRVGDRSSRDDDRQLFLEALLSAREQVVVTYTGRDIRDNAELSPSVVVEELLDHVARAFRPTDDAGRSLCEREGPDAWARDRLTVVHPLQPWSPAYFAASARDGEEGADAPLFSYSAAWGGAARGLAGPGTTRRPFVGEALDGAAALDRAAALDGAAALDRAAALDGAVSSKEVVSLADLRAYFVHPARYLVRDVLGVRLGVAEEVRPDREPLEVDGLERFAIGQDLLEHVLAGGDPWALHARVAARGLLPLGAAGRAAFGEIADEVGGLADCVDAVRSGDALPPLEVGLDCGAVRIEGRLDGLHPGGRIVHRFARLGQPGELDAWIAHLVLCALAPAGVRLETHLIGRPSRDEGRHACFAPVDRPLEHLAALVAIYRTGITVALPLFPSTSRKYARVRLRDPDDPERARQARLDAYEAFAGERSDRPDGADPYVHQLFDGVDPLAEGYVPIGLPAGAGDRRFAALALDVFAPLLGHRSKRA